MKDLAVIVADKNMSFALRGLLKHQAKSLGIREIEFEIEPHPGHDGGVRSTGPATLARFHREFQHGIIMLDWEGCGTELAMPGLLEADLDARLHTTWGERARSIVVAPEIDAWMWGNDSLLKEILGWDRDQPIRGWLRSRGFEFDDRGKPARPKEALGALMIALKRPRSSSIYESITARIGLRRCTDPAFGRLRATLRAWFPAG